MSIESDAALKSMLSLRPDTSDILKSRENTRLEFKQSFSFADQASYAKTMLGFANNRGGFLVFGVEDKPHRLLGVDRSKFATYDPVHLTSFLSSHASALVEWEFGTIEFEGVTLGYIFTDACVDKPTIVTSNHKSILKEGEIYYRYAGQTRTIRFPELEAIINARLERERRAWMAHLEAIGRAGPTNVGILDTLSGEMYGGGGTFLIEQSLVDKLKFIRQGSFEEAAGSPTLRLVGELHEVSSVVAPIRVPAGIHVVDMLKAAIAPEELPMEVALSYLEETADQNTWILPVFRFARAAELEAEQAASIVEHAATSYDKTRETVVSRLLGKNIIGRMGRASREVPIKLPSDAAELAEAVAQMTRPMDQRAALVGALHICPDTVVEAVSMLPVVRLCEALMHLEFDVLIEKIDEMRRIVRALLDTRFEGMGPNEKSNVRKTIAYLDQQMYSWHLT